MLLSAIQTMFDRLMPPGSECYWKADFFEVTQVGAQLLLAFGSSIHTFSNAHVPINVDSRQSTQDATMGVMGILHMQGYCWCDSPENADKITKMA
jgi:hypothetical protein